MCGSETLWPGERTLKCGHYFDFNAFVYVYTRGCSFLPLNSAISRRRATRNHQRSEFVRGPTSSLARCVGTLSIGYRVRPYGFYSFCEKFNRSLGSGSGSGRGCWFFVATSSIVLDDDLGACQDGVSAGLLRGWLDAVGSRSGAAGSYSKCSNCSELVRRSILNY